jgi:hypothetical protein
MEEYCKIEMEGYEALTDRNGRAVFKDFKLLRGPTGTYGFKYKTSDL